MPSNRVMGAVGALLLLVCACSPTPEQARAKIEASGITFDAAGLSRAVMANDTKAVRWFIAAGHDVNSFEDRGSAPLALAVRLSHPPMLRTLLDAGARAEKLPGILLIPATRDDLDTLELLLDAGADVDGRDTDYRTALLAAIEYGRVDAVRFLLERGADPDGLKQGGVPVIRAIRGGEIGIAEILLEAGARPPKRAANVARRTGHEELAKRLEEIARN